MAGAGRRPRLCCTSLLPRGPGIQPHAQPLRIGRVLQIASQIRQLFDLRRENRRFHVEMLAVRDRAGRLVKPTAPRNRGSQHLALPDELRGKPRGAAAFAGRATQNQRVPTILDNRVGVSVAVGAGYLRNRLKAQDTPAAELAQPRERVFQTVNLSEGIQLVDDEPQALGVIRPPHRRTRLLDPWPRISRAASIPRWSTATPRSARPCMA